MPKRQKVLVLQLADSALDSKVVAWAQYDGTGERRHMSGDADEPPYDTGVAALLDGWRLFHISSLQPAPPGGEFTTSYFKYEFAFEQWVQVDE